VKVGVVTDLSGSQSAIGTDELRGAQLAAEEINAAGGIKGLKGKKIDLKSYDTQTSPDHAVTAANAAVSDGVSAIVGGLTSDEVLAGTNVSHRAHIPWISAASSEEITGRGFDDVFQDLPTTAQAAQNYFKAIEFVAQSLDLGNKPTASVAVSDSTYGKGIEEEFSKANSGGSFDVKDEVSYPPTTTNLSSVVAKTLSKSPQMLINLGYPADGIAIQKLLATKFEYKPKVYFAVSDVATALEQLGSKANGMIIPSGPTTDFKNAPARFLDETKKYTAKHGGDAMPQYAVVGYVEMMMVAAALEDSGTTDGASVAKALHGISLDESKGNLYPSQPLAFNDKGQLTDPPQYFVQIENSKPVPVYPSDIAAAEPVPYK